MISNEVRWLKNGRSEVATYRLKITIISLHVCILIIMSLGLAVPHHVPRDNLAQRAPLLIVDGIGEDTPTTSTAIST